MCSIFNFSQPFPGFHFVIYRNQLVSPLGGLFQLLGIRECSAERGRGKPVSLPFFNLSPKALHQLSREIEDNFHNAVTPHGYIDCSASQEKTAEAPSAIHRQSPRLGVIFRARGQSVPV